MKLGRVVKRVTILGSDVSGQNYPTVVYKKRRKSKKGSPGLRNLEKMTRNVIEGQSTQMDTYLRRHKRSNRKRRNGWMRDMGTNVLRAASKGMKKVRPARWF